VTQATTWLTSESPAVTFMPLASWSENGSCPLPALVQQIVRELGQPLRELGRRARRMNNGSRGTVVLVASCNRKMGCTTTAAALAAAQADGSSLVIDGDLEQPAVRELFGIDAGPDWEDVVHGRSQMSEALKYCGEGRRCAVLGLRGPAPRATVKNASASNWIARLREEHDLIVIDGGPIRESALWAGAADAALIVCDTSRAQADEWSRAWDRLEECGAQVLGIVETFA
jgi:Mrp family chromosome partitioning ATPase